MPNMRIGDVLQTFDERLGARSEPEILTLTEKRGFVSQKIRFNKRLATEDTSNYKVIRKSDIAFNPYLLWAGAIAQNIDWNEAIISPTYPTFRVRKGFDPRFVNYRLSSEPLRQRFDSISFGAVPRRRRAATDSFLELDFGEVPSLSEQHRIAKILDKASALRAKRREVISKLDQLLQSVFLDMFGDVSLNVHEWPEVSFGDLVESTKLGLVRGASEFGNQPHFDVPYIRMDAIGRGGEFLRDKVKKTTATAKDLAESAVRFGDFLFNTRNSKELVGKSTVIDFNPPSWTFNNNVMRIRFNQRANPFYMLRYLLSHRAQMELDRRKSGTTNVFAVYYKDLKTLPVVLPPKELQDKFQSMVEAQRKVRDRSIKQERMAEALMQTLQQAAFSGKL